MFLRVRITAPLHDISLLQWYNTSNPVVAAMLATFVQDYKSTDARDTLEPSSKPARASFLALKNENLAFPALYTFLQYRSRFSPPIPLYHTSHDRSDVLELHVIGNV
jgi:hypothetical protein